MHFMPQNKYIGYLFYTHETAIGLKWTHQTKTANVDTFGAKSSTLPIASVIVHARAAEFIGVADVS